MKKIVLLASVFIFCGAAFAQNDKATQHARELMEVMGSAKLMTSTMDQMIAAYKQSLPDVPTEFWDMFRKEMNVNDVIELIVPIYTKYYTDDELVQLIAFYKTPLGQKYVEKLPLITQESFTAGQEWGKKIGEKAIAKLKEKGYLKD